MKMGRLGVWAQVDCMTASAEAEFARDVEQWGYSALWTPEAMGRDVLVNSGWLLANTRKLVIASGIANIFARDAMAMAAARVQLNEQSGGRLLLGMGISHAPIVSAIRGHIYEKPVTTMRTYVEAMAHAEYSSPRPSDSTLTVIAALGPKMLALARDFADGAHPYNTTVAQTAAARAVLGPNKLLCVEQKVLLETNAASAREVARAYLRPYLRLSNYVNSWRASTTAISPTMGRIDSSARWSRGAMKMRSSGASASTGRRARITSAFKRCMRIRANRRSMDPIST